MAKSKAGMEINCVDQQRKKPTAIDKYCFGIAILRNVFSRFARSRWGGRVGYAAGSSFLIGFQLSFTFKRL